MKLKRGDSRRRSARRTLLAAVCALAVLGTDLVEVPAASASPLGVAELPALHSEAPPEVAIATSKADFSNPPPADGDVAARNDDAARERRENEPVFDPATAELVSRSATTEFYRNDDGTRTALVYQRPVNFQDATGKWHRIDDELVTAPDGSLAPRSSPLGVRFAPRSDASNVVRVNGTGWTFGFRMQGAAGRNVRAERPALPEDDGAPPSQEPSDEGRPEARTAPAELDEPEGIVDSKPEDAPVVVASYGEVMPGVTLRYIAGANTIKEELELANPPSGPLAFRFPLSLTGLTARAIAGGGVELVDLTGHVVATFPTGVMVDSAPSSRPVRRGRVGVRLEQSTSGPMLVLEPDPAWLADPARVYPVRIDPTATIGYDTSPEGTGDAWVDTVYPNETNDGANQYAGYGISLNKQGYGVYFTDFYFHSYDYFPLPFAANANKHVHSAAWSGHFFVGGGGKWVRMHPAAGPWAPSTVTYNNQPWWYSGTGYDSLIYPADDSRVSVGITSWADMWAKGTLPNRGLAFEAENSWTEFGSMESTFLTWDPYLTLNYNTVPPASTLTAPADGEVLATTTPTLSATSVTDAEGETVKYWFRASTNPGGDTGVVYNSGWLDSPTVTVPAGTLQDGVTYYWKVYTGDFAANGKKPIDQTTSAVRSFKVDKRLGDQPTNPMDDLGPLSVNLSNGNLTVDTASPSFPTVGGDIGLTFTYNSQQPIDQGLRGSYYDEGTTPDFVIGASQEPFVVRTDPRIDFSWGADPPAPGAPANNFLVRWKGYVRVPTPGPWQFGARADDGVRIWVNEDAPTASPFNGQLNSWTDRTALPEDPQYGSSVTLTPGQWYPIQVDYYEHGTTATGITLYARPEGDTSDGQIVDATWLSTSAPTLPTGWRANADLDGAYAYTGANVSTNVVVLIDASGEPHSYVWTGSGFKPPKGEDSTLVRNADGTLTLHGDDGTNYLFAATGQLMSATAAGLDDRTPAAPEYHFTTSLPPRLDWVQDRVSGRKLKLFYGGDSQCPGDAPPGFDSAAPPGMLCELDYSDFDSGVTKLWYAEGQLARLEDPGPEVTDFGYEDGRMTRLRSPLAAEVIAAGVRANEPLTQTLIRYDTNGRVLAVLLPQPLPSAARPAHLYRYVSATETQVDVAGLVAPNGFARKVTFDTAGRTLSDTDATAKTSTMTWDVRDRPVTSTDPAGLTTTTSYDPQGRPVSVTGPAPAGTPNPPTTATTYDGGLNGLLATFWNNTTLKGIPKVSKLGVDNTTLAKNWGTNSPVPGVINADSWSMRLTGEIYLASAGTYQFHLYEDNGAVLSIDDKAVAGDWNLYTAGWLPWESYINTTAGTWHRIQVDYFEVNANANFAVNWKPPGTSTEVGVPNTVLTPRLDLITSTTDPDGKVSSTSYSAPGIDPVLGLATATTEDPGNLTLTTATGYEAPGAGYLRSTSRTLPAGNTWTYQYYGDTESQANPCGAGSANQAGNLKSNTGPDPDGAGLETAHIERFRYDNAGRTIATKLDTDADWSCLEYDNRGRLIKKTIPAFGGEPARTVTYNHAVGGNPLTSVVADPTGEIQSKIDLLGRVIAYTDVWGKTTTTVYDQAGRAADSAGPIGAMHLEYDSAGRVELIRRNALVLADPSYDAAGDLSTVSYPSGVGNAGNGTSLAPIGHDNLGRLSDLVWIDAFGAVMTSDHVTRSPAGRITTELIDNTDSLSFDYDGAGRLTNATLPGHTFNYEYSSSSSCPLLSAAGKNTNRTKLTDTPTGGGAPASTEYCYDHADKLVSTTDPSISTIDYDDHGSTTTLGTETLTYDGADRHMTSTDGSTAVRYVRDATDRIIERRENGDVVRYSYTGDGDTSDLTLNRDGDVIERTVGLPGGAALTISDDGDAWSYPNIHGDIVVTANAAGTKTAGTFKYDPFGNELAGLPDNSEGDYDYGWLGQNQRGTEHAPGLRTIVEMGARQYDPILGRFLEVDPIEGGTINDYSYVEDPINQFDLDGEGWCKDRKFKRKRRLRQCRRMQRRLRKQFIKKYGRDAWYGFMGFGRNAVHKKLSRRFGKKPCSGFSFCQIGKAASAVVNAVGDGIEFVAKKVICPAARGMSFLAPGATGAFGLLKHWMKQIGQPAGFGTRGWSATAFKFSAWVSVGATVASIGCAAAGI